MNASLSHALLRARDEDQYVDVEETMNLSMEAMILNILSLQQLDHYCQNFLVCVSCWDESLLGD